ncbi:hypothetical protein V1279_002935 [Bradyrhizobium sp. AZCC 1610]|jgi:hypothetical protein
MESHVREVKKEVQRLKDSGEIEDFDFDHDKRHHRIRFLFKGKWHSIPFAASPRTSNTNKFTRQQIRRIIRSVS